MANGQTTIGKMTKQQTAEAIAKFQRANPGKKLPVASGGGIAHGTIKQPEPVVPETAEVTAEVTAESAGVVAEVVREIPPKEFSILQFSQGSVDACVLTMTMQDIADYTCYAKDLYQVVEGTEAVDPTVTWQRQLNPKRASKEIGPYLQNELHFFPSIVCVVAAEEVGISPDTGKITLVRTNDEDGNSIGSLAILDGQHRCAGIISQLQNQGPDSDFAKEEISVIVLLSEMSVEDRQQIFADINRMGKVVSKAINILYDHRDKYAVLAHDVAKTLNFKGQVVELEKNTPTPKSSNVCSLTNIYNLVANFAASDTKHPAISPMRDGVSPKLIHDVAVSMIQSLPGFDRLQAGHGEKYGVMRGMFLCYSSTMFQAMGNASKIIHYGTDTDHLVETLTKLVKLTPWEAANTTWVRPGVEFIKNGKMGTRTDDVSKATTVLAGMWSELVKSGQK